MTIRVEIVECMMRRVDRIQAGGGVKVCVGWVGGVWCERGLEVCVVLGGVWCERGVVVEVVGTLRDLLQLLHSQPVVDGIGAGHGFHDPGGSEVTGKENFAITYASLL